MHGLVQPRAICAELWNTFLWIILLGPWKVYQTIRAEAEGLQQFSSRGRIVPELRFNGVLLYRELMVAPWQIIYRIEGSNVWVLAVIDSRRDVANILLERFIG